MYAPCVVLVINDNLYGLMCKLSFTCRFVHWHRLGHVLVSRFEDEEMSKGVTPSESALCKFQRNPPNPHRNDSKVPTRHLRAGGKRSNNITQQSSMGPTEQIYIQHGSMSQEHRYIEQRSKSPWKQYSVQLRTRCKWG